MVNKTFGAAIVILTYEGEKWIEPCMRSVIKAGICPDRVWIVDNASTDATCSIVKNRFPEITLIQNKTNVGFAAGNNTAIRSLLETDIEYFILINQDVRVDPDCIKHLRFSAEKHGPGLYAPVQLSYDGSHLDTSMRDGILSRAEGFVDDLWSGRLAECYEIPVAYGGALMIHRQVFERVGLFDECYFLYGEDEDFCRRAMRAGFKIWLIPNARVQHWHTLVERERDPSFSGQALMRRARIIHALKNPSRRWSSRLASTVLTLFSDAVHGLARGDGSAVKNALEDSVWMIAKLRQIKRSRDLEQKLFERAGTEAANPELPCA